MVSAKLVYELLSSRHELLGMKERYDVPDDNEWLQYVAHGNEIATAICRQTMEAQGVW